MEKDKISDKTSQLDSRGTTTLYLQVNINNNIICNIITVSIIFTFTCFQHRRPTPQKLTVIELQNSCGPWWNPKIMRRTPYLSLDPPLCMAILVKIIKTYLFNIHIRCFRKIAKKRLLVLSCQSVRLFVHPSGGLSVRMEQLSSHWTDFHEILYFTIFRK